MQPGRVIDGITNGLGHVIAGVAESLWSVFDGGERRPMSQEQEKGAGHFLLTPAKSMAGRFRPSGPDGGGTRDPGAAGEFYSRSLSLSTDLDLVNGSHQAIPHHDPAVDGD